MQADVRVINELVRKESAFIDDVLSEVDKVIVGQLNEGFPNGHHICPTSSGMS